MIHKNARVQHNTHTLETFGNVWKKPFHLITPITITVSIGAIQQALGDG